MRYNFDKLRKLYVLKLEIEVRANQGETSEVPEDKRQVAQMILAGKKTWKIRRTPTNFRGRFSKPIK